MVERRQAGSVARFSSQKIKESEDRLLAVLVALAEPTRLAALRLIWANDELCLCEIIDALGVTQSRASRHMAVLVQSGILLGRRQAQWVRYRLNKKLPKYLYDVLEASVLALPLLKLKTVSSCDVKYKKKVKNEKDRF